MPVAVSINDFIYVTDISVTDNGMSLPCHLLVRYMDPRWKRYGYPFIAGDLRIRLDDAFCERSSIHKDDIHAFVSRLKRYVPTIEADATVSVVPGQASRPTVPYIQHKPQPFGAPQPPVVTYQTPRPEYTQQQAVQYNAAIPGQRIQKSKGCGCRKG